MNRRLFVLAALAVAGCATRPPPVVAPAGSPLAELEPIYRIEATRRSLVIRVGSRGCTAKADFAFYLERRGGAVTLAFGRRRVEVCPSPSPGHADISFSWAELGVPPRTPVFLLNPLAASDDP